MLRIKEINVGNLQEKKVNAIFWSITLTRKQEIATAQCELLFVDQNGGSQNRDESFSMEIPNSVLQQWGADDSVIDTHILTYSPLFEKDINFD